MRPPACSTASMADLEALLTMICKGGSFSGVGVAPMAYFKKASMHERMEQVVEDGEEEAHIRKQFDASSLDAVHTTRQMQFSEGNWLSRVNSACLDPFVESAQGQHFGLLLDAVHITSMSPSPLCRQGCQRRTKEE